VKPKQSIARTVARPAAALTKSDPYASRTHRRIDLVLLVVTIVIVLLVLRASAHGQTFTINSVAPNHSSAPQQATSK